MKKILISTVAAAMVTSSLMAAAQNSNINFGSDINGTVQSLTLVSGIADYNVTTNGGGGTAAATVNVGSQGIVYIPTIGLGKGNLITVLIKNGYVHDSANNKLYLVDKNSTLATDNNASGQAVAARMTDFTSSVDGKGYSQMTFKFDHDVSSQTVLTMVDTEESNGTANVGYNTNLDVRANKGLSCGDTVTVSVIDSTDQSGAKFPVADAPASKTSVAVFSALTIGQNPLGALVNDNATSRPVKGKLTSGAKSCPIWSCSIALPNETSFGTVGSTVACPTCTPTTTPTLICGTAFNVNYQKSTKTANDIAVSSIDYTMTTTDTSGISSFVTYAGAANLDKALTVTPTNNVYTASLASGNGVATGSNTVYTDITVDGTTVIKPRSFDLAVKANTNVAVDTIKNFLSFTEGGTTLSVAYLNANPDYRSFVRVTSTAAATIQAVVTTEDGSVSKRVDVTKADGSIVTIGANGGAAVVEAADMLRSAKDAGFTGAGNRFNATLYVKTTGTVDAVAFQNANGSQRYLPVGGATGGGKL